MLHTSERMQKCWFFKDLLADAKGTCLVHLHSSPLQPGHKGRFSRSRVRVRHAPFPYAQMTNLESISVPLNRPIAKCTDRKMDFALLNRLGGSDSSFQFSNHFVLLPRHPGAEECATVG
ncbi:hypothetical protein Pcinc_027025 [Petrolisthes cinctipes]|uniref:Uncharacterized protein n=1 Tax=Petrolisthes cinctipes TaxID=88211 RepID=A0AAE1F6X6_PETCI|nr:hypothetical protein Pcinc_027025 [Petrolisthes cinctipes]